jgi:superoxide dismutase
MAYEWKFNARPYSDEEAKELLKAVVSPETSDWHYNTHHKGYVNFLNKIEQALPNADKAAANGNWSDCTMCIGIISAVMVLLHLILRLLLLSKKNLVL